MNYRGSYRKLLANSKAAMLAAIEIYNKPQIVYRDETFCILLINAWELLAKAILSKNKERIMYTRREAGVSYRTYSLYDAFIKAKQYFPDEIPYEPVKENVSQIVKFRDNAIHFYNDPGFSVIMYGLAQASIVTYRDLVLAVFGFDITDEVTIVLLPLGLGAAPDPIEFMKGNLSNSKLNRIVATYLRDVVEMSRNLGKGGFEAGRFLTYFDVSLNSIKKSTEADLVVAFDGTRVGIGEPILVEKRVDPNVSHPLKRKDVLQRIRAKLKNDHFNNRDLNPIVYTHKAKDNSIYCWKGLGGSIQYSHDFVAFVCVLSPISRAKARSEYQAYLASKRRIRKSKL